MSPPMLALPPPLAAPTDPPIHRQKPSTNPRPIRPIEVAMAPRKGRGRGGRQGRGQQHDPPPPQPPDLPAHGAAQAAAPPPHGAAQAAPAVHQQPPYNTRSASRKHPLQPLPILVPSGSRPPASSPVPTLVLTYAQVLLGKEKVAAQEAANRERRDAQEAINIQHMKSFLHFLTTYKKKPTDECPFYRADLHAVCMRGDYVLHVNFNHLLNKKFLPLAFRIGNEQSHEWLRPAAEQFLAGEDLVATKRPRELMFDFTNKPIVMSTLQEFLEANKDNIKFDVNILSEDISPSSYLGRALYGGVINHFLDLHQRERTYRGDFTAKELLVLQSSVGFSFIVMKSSVPVSSSSQESGRAMDLHSISDMMKPFFENVLLFEALNFDLENATESEAGSLWFREYLRYHIALFTPASRRNLICLLHMDLVLYKRGHFVDNWALNQLLGTPPFEDINWANEISKSGNAILEGLFFFVPNATSNQSSATSGSPATTAAGSVGRSQAQPASGKLHGIPLTAAGSVGRSQAQPASGQLGGIPPTDFDQSLKQYSDTIESILDFHRNGLEHVPNHIPADAKGNKPKIKELDDIEIYLAKKMHSSYLPWLLKRLLQLNVKLPEEFRSAWSNFKASLKDTFDYSSM